jgi:hypothetical protein
MSHDYSEHVQPQSEDGLAQLSRLAEEQLERQKAVAAAEAELEKRKDELRDIQEVTIPELMEELGIETFTTSNGLKVSVKEDIRASILAANKAQAFQWLRDNGHSAIIKRIVKVQFGMGEDEQAEQAIEALGDLPVEDESNVHWQTLCRFARELLSEGQEIPEELFSVHRQRVSKIKV